MGGWPDACAQVSGAGGLDKGDAVQVEKSVVDLGPCTKIEGEESATKCQVDGGHAAKVAGEAGGEGQLRSSLDGPSESSLEKSTGIHIKKQLSRGGWCLKTGRYSYVL